MTPHHLTPDPTPDIQIQDLRGHPPGTIPPNPSAHLLLTDSDPAASAWQTLAPTHHIAAIPPIATPTSPPTPTFTALHLLLGAHPTSDTLRQAAQANAYTADRSLACHLLDPAAATLALYPAAIPTPGAATLDLRTGMDLLTLPLPLLAALAAGQPLLFLDPAPIRTALAHQGAAHYLQNLETGLPAYAALPKATRTRLATAAQTYIATHHSPAIARSALQIAIAAARNRQVRHLQTWPQRTETMNVLVLSDEALNLLEIRVHLPFRSLHARHALAGYAILRHGEWAFTTAPITPQTEFHAIWVQRSLDPLVELFLQALDRPFVYDLDDLLLVSPAYRPPFPVDSATTARSLIAKACIVSCATARLAACIQTQASPAATIITPNLPTEPPRQVAGAPRTIVWASSDQPALAASRREIERAVRDFCRAHDLPLLCIGAEPPAAFAGLDVEHLGLLAYPTYLQRLQAAAPGILLAPLETHADPATQAFVDAKSDIKLIEARQAGLIPVASRAAPYLETDLEPPILCDNTYQSWLDGLERARRLCVDPPSPTPWPDHRATDRLGPLPYADAIHRARTHLTAADITSAIRFVRAQGETLLCTPDLFDEADYLGRNTDVRDAVAAGIVASGYRHYVQSGFREGREAKRLATLDGAAAFWWTRLLHTLTRLESGLAPRAQAIADLTDRAAHRRPQPEPQPPKIATEIDWSPAKTIATPCPVCETPGPHRATLAYMGEILATCRKCTASFYERRIPYDYEDPQARDLLLQFNLEQNAGIHHQIRPLFAFEGTDSLLDIGCGFGFAVDLATQRGWRATGLDPSFYAAAGRTALKADIRSEYLTTETNLSTPYTLVQASEVLEHLPEPHGFLALVRSHLAPNGTLVLSTPNADAIAPTAGPARLLALLAPRVHLVLFSPNALTHALQRAGFRHITVTAQADTLLAHASDRPLRLNPTADADHAAAYAPYLRSLMARATPGSPLWNGAAGRLLAWLTPSEIPAALLAEIAKTLRKTHSIDLADPPTPPPSATATEIAKRMPVNLPDILLNRALIEARAPTRIPQKILAHARPAYRLALQTGRALQAANMIDHDLRQTTQRARMLILDALAELAPELEPTLLQTLLHPSPSALAEWTDPPPDRLTPRLAHAYATATTSAHPEEAARLHPALTDLDLLCRTLDTDDQTLLRTLLALAQHHLPHDPAAAVPPLHRMAAEARLRLHRGPAIADLLHTAEHHLAQAHHRLENPEIAPQAPP